MIGVVTFKWSKPGYRSQFTAEHVNTLQRMVARHFPHPHRFICFTDDPAGLAPEVDARRLWTKHATVSSPHGDRNPACYRRLRLWARDAANLVGLTRFVTLDLDCVITGDLGPLWLRREDVVLYRGQAARTHYNGSMALILAGSRPAVWEEFDPDTSPSIAYRAGFFGSDQAWISYRLGPQEPTWGIGDGVYSYRNDIAPNGGRLPSNARIVFFHGKVDPWSDEAQRLAWVRENYR